MRRLALAATLLLSAGAVPALAQSDTLATRLPAPPVDDNAAPIAFIQAATQALAAGRVAEAQEAIERAESRALDRPVRPSLADKPSQQPLVQQLNQARQALASGDKMQAMTLLEVAAKNPEASAPAPK